MYPRLLIDLKKLNQNLTACAQIIHKHPKCSLMVVTKGICSDSRVVRLVLESRDVDYIADSRIQNIASFSAAARAAGKKTVLLRIPMQSEVDEVVRHVDLSFHSECATLRLLDQAALRAGTVHSVLLMVDLGDLREGIFFQDDDKIMAAVQEILALKHIRLHGLGVNLTCYGAVIPKHDNLSQLVRLAKKIENQFGISLPMLSGGNSSSIYLIQRGELPEGINNLRLGESFLLGTESAYAAKLPGTAVDAMLLQAEIIELQEKPSLPIGEIGVDAFGQKPCYEDRGMMKRAIVAIGRQDTDLENLSPTDRQIHVLGGSSDHTILDITACDTPYQVGDIVTFSVGYSAMLKAATSAYVEKVYLPPIQ